MIKCIVFNVRNYYLPIKQLDFKMNTTVEDSLYDYLTSV